MPKKITHSWPQFRLFACKVCSARSTVPKLDSRRRTSPGHIKTMWCWKCKAITDHIQIE